MLNDRRLILDWTKVHDVYPIEKKLANEHQTLWQARDALISRRGASPELTGWIDNVCDSSEVLCSQVIEQAETIKKHSDAIVVIGIGGSLLGAKALNQALTHAFSGYRKICNHHELTVFWAGYHLATDELADLLDVLDDYTPALVVISKSGSTMEPALSFRILKQYLDKRFGMQEANARVTVITDPTNGLLHDIAHEYQYPMFSIPKDVGGRYSVFTAAGLLPLALSGVPIQELLEGVNAAREDSLSEKNNSLETNVALCYAGIRNLLYKENYKIEALCVWSPKLKSIGDWWVHLFGESDAKNGGGIFPVSTQFTTDLHSMGQYFQEGERHLFATHLKVVDEFSSLQGTIKRKLEIPPSSLSDGCDYLARKSLSYIQSEAQAGTVLAHSDGEIPTLVWELPELNAWWLGYWMYTNMFACAVGDYARGINPFDQPGIEKYKKNMYSLLGKPGEQKNSMQIKNRIQATKRLRSFGMTSFHGCS